MSQWPEPPADTQRRADTLRELLVSRDLLSSSKGKNLGQFGPAELLLGPPSPLRAGCQPHAALRGLELSPAAEASGSSGDAEAIARRGVALIAAKPFQKGELLWEEGPITALQQARHLTGRVCATCFRFLGARREQPGADSGHADTEQQEGWLRQLAWHCVRYGVSIGSRKDEAAPAGTDFPDVTLDPQELARATEADELLRANSFTFADAIDVIENLQNLIAIAAAGGDSALFSPETGAVPCRFACGEMFCGDECQSAAQAADHELLCVGRVEDASHPLVKLKVMSIEQNDLFFAGLRVTASVIRVAGAMVSSGCSVDAALREAHKLLNAYLGASYIDLPSEASETDAEHHEIKRDTVRESYDLLHQAFVDVTDSAALLTSEERQVAEVLISLDWWDTLLGRLNMNNHAVWVASPLHAAYARALGDWSENDDDLEAAHPDDGVSTFDVVAAGVSSGSFRDSVFSKCAARVLLPVLEEVSAAYREAADAHGACDSDESDGESEDGSSFDDDDDARSCDSDAHPEMARVAAMLPGCEGLGVLAVAATMNHSCKPNTIVRYERHSFVGAVRALQDIDVGEELTHSYIENRAPVLEREADLRPYRFRCECGQCVEDRQ
jgi:SET domain